eukprot:902580-Amphidinium_carterae.1
MLGRPHNVGADDTSTRCSPITSALDNAPAKDCLASVIARARLKPWVLVSFSAYDLLSSCQSITEDALKVPTPLATNATKDAPPGRRGRAADNRYIPLLARSVSDRWCKGSVPAGQ